MTRFLRGVEKILWMTILRWNPSHRYCIIALMLDIKFIRENKDLIALGAKKKHIAFNVDALIVVDDKRRAITTSIEAKRAEQNVASEAIAKVGPAERAPLLESVKALKASMQKEEET